MLVLFFSQTHKRQWDHSIFFTKSVLRDSAQVRGRVHVAGLLMCIRQCFFPLPAPQSQLFVDCLRGAHLLDVA